MTRVWIDIENPPQVQYLTPLVSAFEAAGAETVVTARDYGETYELLRALGIPFTPVGSSYGARKHQKALGLAGRTRALLGHLRRTGRPDASVSASRAAVIATRLLRRPSFALIDYEHVHLGVFRRAGSHILHPDVIEPDAFVGRGIERQRLIPFRGLKEDLTFGSLGTTVTDPVPGLDDGLVHALVRPAAEESHYYRSESGEMTLVLLERLAAEQGTVVVFSPRYPRQVEYLERFDWAHDPVVLSRPLPVVQLLNAVDVVISSGGTMLREAAYLGVPAYSLFQGEVGGVDRHLESIGRLRLVTSTDDLDAITLEKAGAREPLRSNPDLAAELVAAVLSRT
jgi:hypothetical protein